MHKNDKYYEQIKEKIIDTEVTEKVKNYTANKVKLENYYEIGRLIIEAQGGETRAKYGDGLIKEYSNKLIVEVNKKYSYRTLFRIRQFYLLFKNTKVSTLSTLLTWSHYTELLSLDDFIEINYYINLCLKQNLKVRELRTRIKNKEYKNLSESTKQKLIENKELSLVEKIPSPVIIDNPNNIEITKEKVLHKLIMEQLSKFLNRLGEGYLYVGDEYSINIGNKNNYIDFLLYNKKFKSYVVVELKIRKLKKEDIGQIEFYMNYIDTNLKEITDDKTIGIILGYKDNDFIMQYCSDKRVIFREYSLN